MAAPSCTKILAFAAFLAHVSAEPGSHMRVDPVTVIPRIVRSGALEGFASAEPSDHIVWDLATETAIIAPSASDASVLERSSGPLKGAVREGKISRESVLAAATICIAGAACDLAISNLQWQSMQELVGQQAASASHHASELTRKVRPQQLQHWNAFREITREKAASLSQLQLPQMPWEGMWRSSMSQLHAIGLPIKQKAATISRGAVLSSERTNPDEVEPPKRTRLASSTALAVVLPLVVWVAFRRRSSATSTKKVSGNRSSSTSVAASKVLFVPVQPSATLFPGRSHTGQETRPVFDGLAPMRQLMEQHPGPLKPSMVRRGQDSMLLRQAAPGACPKV
mmetsp:Transcript_159819/g.512847  ORF Transcript_159819/g.512847 Transcript_159819/m.512847 type:complete len:340 (+) Transcript_159819:83-1102(+)|eukprot:CAMPEP_0203940778 /NCGR_PEP_ID=MMETSP0359-20131031/77278_1 /ASSEMBLY_ACC=CAM_ASM_000338 /TAXON_ID=268821 /ORGANISM="Scrippsiella Hangoei, Strain SHTV-5" /LENGTH=339 /DNA_ID=CAMNT_0050871241 /DNA_START=50 /DNA_END=1069 /DNA_ORIENTATION=-